jgi:hypothetical protein
MKKIILSLLVVVLAGLLFTGVCPALADGPEFSPPACSSGNGEPGSVTCGYYIVDRDINFTPALTNAFVFVYEPEPRLAGMSWSNYALFDTSNWNVVDQAPSAAAMYANLVPLNTQAIPKSYFDANGGMDGLFTKVITATVPPQAPCPQGTSWVDNDQYGNNICEERAAVKPATKPHLFSLYVVVTDKYDVPDKYGAQGNLQIQVKPGTLLPWSNGDSNPFVQTQLGNPITEKRLIYSPLGVLGNKIILYRSQEVYYVNQGTAKTVSRRVDLPVPVVQGIQPIPGTVLVPVATSAPSSSQDQSHAATATDRGAIHPMTTSTPSFADFIGSFFSGFGKFLQSLFRF